MFSDPVKNLKALGLREDDIVADLGAGTGYYTIASAHLVPKGKVYAVEVEKDFLMTVKNKARDAHLTNVETFWGNVEKKGGTKIGSNIVDAVIASNILFQIEDKNTFIEEIKRILKPKGKVLVVDWEETSVIGGRRAVPKDKAKELFSAKGFTLEREIDAGNNHYGMILTT